MARKCYRVKVEAYVLVDADNVPNAKANAEKAVKKAVAAAYSGDDAKFAGLFADDWSGFSFRARSAAVWLSGGDDDC